MFRHILAGGIILILVIGILGCGDDKNPTSSRPIQSTPLAGGGRLADNDPAGGRVDSSSPGLPGFDSLPGLVPLFYSYIDCAENPGERIITQKGEWEAWWQKANSCLYNEPPPWPPDSGGWDSMPWDSLPFDSLPWDSMPWDSMGDTTGWDSTIDTIIWPPPPPDTGHTSAPPVNFDSFVVVVISLAPDSMTFGRSIWVDEVTTDAGGTVIRYTVSSLGEDCVQILMMPMMITSSAVIAVMAPRPIVEPITWIRTDTVFNCTWDPDPNLPVTVYYTDAPCVLGSGDSVITDSATFAVWLDSARACDSRHWRYGLDSGFVNPTFPPIWFSPEVNFTTHAVIILRSGYQTRLGGGIWLDRFEVSPSGTTIDYTVMEPGDDCPVVAPPLGAVNPTVAIRVPLPINLPITWHRNVQPIQCNWSDSTVIGGGGTPGP